MRLEAQQHLGEWTLNALQGTRAQWKQSARDPYAVLARVAVAAHDGLIS